ncbi:MAG: hypothetical protein V4558_08960 [Gemmatimonadota bacterium]
MKDEQPKGPFPILVFVYVVIFWIVNAAMTSLLDADNDQLTGLPLFAVSFFVGSASALFDVWKSAPDRRRDRILFVCASAVLWLGVGVIDYTGPRHSDNVLSTGLAESVGWIGFEFLSGRARAIRARRRAKRDE